MTTVIHCRDTARVPAGQYVYCGRPSKWGNPYRIGVWKGRKEQVTREDAIDYFREYWSAPEQAQLRAEACIELRDKVCGCWCHPKPCHVEIIADYVNSFYA